jgi:hypothetical protein
MICYLIDPPIKYQKPLFLIYQASLAYNPKEFLGVITPANWSISNYHSIEGFGVRSSNVLGVI